MGNKVETALNKIEEALEALRELDDSRERSIAITHLETAELWIIKLKSYEGGC